MELKELRQKIKEAPNWEIFTNEVIEFTFPRIGLNRKFTGISAFYEYVLDQIDGFSSFEGNLPKEIIDSSNYFKDLKNKILSFINSYYTISKGDFTQVWNREVKLYTTGKWVLSIFEFNAPVTIFLVEIFQNKSKNYRGAKDYLSETIVVNELQKRDYLNGIILAYEYFQKGETELIKRRAKEKSTLSRLRNQIDNYISDAEQNFIKLAKNLESNVNSTTNEITIYKDEKSKLFEEWYGEISSKFLAFNEHSKSRIEELEILYRDKLKLEAPAKYWRDRSGSLRKEGYWWLGALVFSVIIGLVLLIISLRLLSDGVLEEIFNDTPSAIKWSVIFITIVSFLAFLIRTFSKLTFSTFHLVRDAEEREQLTFVFLAMQKEQAIDPTERHLIMQSLFSRADTGLLKDEGSPTMPGNIFDKVIANSR